MVMIILDFRFGSFGKVVENMFYCLFVAIPEMIYSQTWRFIFTRILRFPKSRTQRNNGGHELTFAFQRVLVAAINYRVFSFIFFLPQFNTWLLCNYLRISFFAISYSLSGNNCWNRSFLIQLSFKLFSKNFFFTFCLRLEENYRGTRHGKF